MVAVVCRLLSLAGHAGGKVLGVHEIGEGLDCRCSLHGIEVEMPEGQHELQRQREQRQSRTRSDVSPEPLHGITNVII